MVLEFMLSLVHSFGYLGVFLASLIGSASIIFPVPSFLFVFLAGKILDPFWVALLSAFGSAIGELTSYGIGIGIMLGKNRLYKRKKKKTKSEKVLAQKIKKWFNGSYGFLIIILFSATPLPDDIVGLYCGSIRYDIKKFFVAMFIGKILLCFFLAYAGYYGLGYIASYFF